ncbi:hypothetical protein ALC53_07003, partial [Atta colombica]
DPLLENQNLQPISLPDLQILGDALDGEFSSSSFIEACKNGKYICDVAIIHKKYVITAAHCLKCFHFRFSSLNFSLEWINFMRIVVCFRTSWHQK